MVGAAEGIGKRRVPKRKHHRVAVAFGHRPHQPRVVEAVCPGEDEGCKIRGRHQPRHGEGGDKDGVGGVGGGRGGGGGTTSAVTAAVASAAAAATAIAAGAAAAFRGGRRARAAAAATEEAAALVGTTEEEAAKRHGSGADAHLKLHPLAGNGDDTPTRRGEGGCAPVHSHNRGGHACPPPTPYSRRRRRRRCRCR